MTLSPEQTACVDAALGSTDNLLISACAGGAKTTTMCAIARAFGPGRAILALTFSKDAAISLEAKMPYYVQSSTFHKYCKDALARHLGKQWLKADGNRCKGLLKEFIPDWLTRRDIEDTVLTLVSRFKSTTHAISESNLNLVAERFDLDAGTAELSLAERILTACLNDRKPKAIDFDDILWLTFHWGVPFPSVAIVLLDEAQDTNGVQRALLRRMLDPRWALVEQLKAQVAPVVEGYTCSTVTGRWSSQAAVGRLIAVGDPHQAIYAFRGADADAFTSLRDDFAMREMSLSVSWRCSVAVVKEAQKFGGLSIQPRDGAPEGSVAALPLYDPSDFPPDAAVLCRNTAPLVSFAFDALARGVACHVVGRDIQVGLDKLIDKGGSDYDFRAWKSQLLIHKDAEVSKLIRKGKKEQAANYEDKVMALLVIAQHCSSKDEVKARLKSIFESGDGLTLSTIHKAKGLEWETVFLLDWNLLPSPYAETPSAKQQERNLQYVAVTRAKLNLRFINSNNWKL